ncbi:phage late control D family protein [Kosakonia cowanii]|uniref:phage late control D family protein n=1 Tax=Kosakonia cowanii TaxID=208223 RepID=UPI003D97D65E
MLNAFTNGLARVKTPAFSLKLGEKDITGNIQSRLIALTVTDNRGFEADTLTLTLDDADGQIEMPERSNVITLAIGWQGAALTEMGTFIVDQVSHKGTPDQVSVTAKSADFRGSLNSPQDSSWHDTTLGAIVEEIAKRNKLDTSLPPSLAQIKIAHIDQSNESDANFLTRLARRNGAEIAVKSGKLFFIVPGMCVVGGETMPSATIARGDGDSHDFSVADRINYSGVTAHWQDTAMPKNQNTVQLQRKSSQQKITPISHPQAVSSQAASNGKNEPTDYTAGSKDNVLILSTTFANKEEAKLAAEAQWSEIQRNAAKFSITLAQGRADLRPETPVIVTGFKNVINARMWVVKKVTHTMNTQGFVSSVELEVRINNVEYDAK